LIGTNVSGAKKDPTGSPGKNQRPPTEGGFFQRPSSDHQLCWWSLIFFLIPKAIKMQIQNFYRNLNSAAITDMILK
jgi:hypothetical protein